MFTIYHNPKCKKSRAGLRYLKEKGNNPVIIEYLKNPISESDLKEILKKLKKEPSEIVRKQEDYFKKELKGKKISNEKWIKILCENPKLIHRPIIVKNNEAVIGDPVENIDVLL